MKKVENKMKRRKERNAGRETKKRNVGLEIKKTAKCKDEMNKKRW